MENKSQKNIEDIIALTPLQEGMLFHYLKEPASDQYFEQLSLEISGKIDVGVFERAWNTVIETNETLRTVFRWEKIENPTQIILKKHKFKVILHDLSNENSNHKQTVLGEIINNNRRETFDLKQPPFRVILCKLDEAKYEVIISNHHILYDGWSNGIILKEFFGAYNDLCGAGVSDKPIKTKFKEFIKWLQNQDKKKQEQYWREYLEGFKTPSELPIKKRRKEDEKGEVENYSIQIKGETQGKLEQFVNSNRITIATVFNSAWGILLQHYCNIEDVLFGVTVSGRNVGIKGIEDMVGLFINTIPLRVKTSEEKKLIEFVLEIERESHAREEFEPTPLSEIRKYSELPGVETLFETLVAVENYPLDNRLNPPNSPLTVESYSIVEKTHYDLAIGVMLSEEITANFYYNSGIFEREAVEKLAGHFERIVRHIIDNSEEKVSRLEFASEEEKYRILNDFNDQGIVFPGNKTLHELFRGQAEKTPDHISIIDRSTQLTYSELNEQSDLLTHELQEKGVLHGAIVGINVERSIEMIIGILGILKTGAAYLPINPKNPKERTDFMLQDTGAKFLVNDELAINSVEEGRHACPSQPLNFSTSQLLISVSSVAYIIYTSGSTGNPKGVPITHANISPLLHWGYKHLGLTSDDRSVQNLSYYFDWSVWEIFIALTSGASLYMVSNEIILDSERYVDFIDRNRITVLHITPTHFQTLIHRERKLNTLRHLCIGAEKLTYDLVKRSYEIVDETCRVYNMYGPTEATIMAAVLEIETLNLPHYKELSSVPIGKTLGNNVLLVLDRNLNLSPLNIPGELYIGGEGVAAGYLNNPERTASSFIQILSGQACLSPTLTLNTNTNIFYKTGDLARWLPDGNVEYLGRIDQQVKVHGYRIELGEIENRLLEHEAVKDAIVVCRQYKTGENYLSAYVVYHPERSTFTANSLKDYLLRRLPDYMVPSYIVKLERMPLNPNGKMDIKALPEPGIIAVGEYIAARDETEKALVNIWRKVLEIDTGRIGIDDDFFELGGHSLNVTSLIGRIQKELKIEIPFTEIFVSPTIRELASYIEQKEESHYGEIPQIEEKEYYPLSSSQKRMYLLHQMNPDSIVYNIHGVMRIEGEVDTGKFENVFLKLIERHESLRTSFEIVDEALIQRILKQIEFKIENIDLKSFIRPFNLSKAPLIRVGLMKQEEKRYFLVIDMNHIISDGASMGVLIKEFISLYKGEELPGLRIQYKDYSQWNKERNNSETLKRQRAYWLERMTGEIPVLNLPTDFARSVVQSFEGAHYRFEIEGEEAWGLKTVALENNTTMYGLLTAIYTILLSKLSGQEEIIIGAPVIGRKSNYEDISHIIGMFVNTLALRLYTVGDKKFSEFVKEVLVTISEANENQEYPFEDLVESIVKKRDAGRNPLFDVMIATQDLDLGEIRIPGLELKPYEYDDHIAKFDMVYICEVRENRILFTVEYSTKLFAKDTIKQIVGYFRKIVKDVLKERDQRIGEIEIMSEEEKNRILYNFNDTQADYPKNKLIHELFRGQAEKTPDHIAIVGVPSSLTYKELDKQSNVLVHELQEKGIEPGDIVGIKIERSIEMIVGILGILKTGAAYMPINPKNPQERTDFMLKDSNAKILLTACSVCPDKISKSSLPTRGRVPFFLESTAAYIIYTSGSTGNPKGVSITHSNFSPLIHWGYHHLGIGIKDRVLQNLAYYFDWSVWEIFITLTTGASLYMVSEDVLLNAEYCVEFLLKNALTVLHITPTQYHYIIGATQQPATLRYLFIGAEKLTYELTKRSIESVDEQCRVFNMYGPTEATIISAVLEIDRKDYKNYESLSSVPIGKPTGCTTLLIVDKNMKLCPEKIVGELYIGGAGVANGYLNNPELTNDKFIMPSATRNPFEKGVLDLPKLLLNQFLLLTLKTNTLYKTGDLARWLPNGYVEFLGRIDHQVKIRGYRIELGEIENALLKHEAVREAAVKVKGENLYAYIVAGSEQSTHEIKEYISTKLPDYMIPSVIVKLDRMPLSPTGKIDLKSLPDPGVGAGESHEAPRNEVEEKLVEIWSEALGIEKEKIGIDANFFEMGGHSLTATLLISKIHKEFSVNIPLVEIFITPYIRGLGEYINRETKERYISIEAVEEREYYELSSAQRRIYLLQRMDKEGVAYNIPAAWILEGKLERNRLEDAFAKLIKRHDSLRTSFEMVEEEPAQIIHDEVEFEIENLATEVAHPFNLSKAPLMRVGLIRIEEEKHIMKVDIHHIISDRMSVQALARDFGALYAGMELPENRLQYRDYAEWQKREKESERLINQGGYWRQEFEGEIPVLDLPSDYVRPVIQSFEGDRINFEICSETTESLRTITLETGTTLYMVLLGIYTILLSKVSGHEDIIIGTPVAGRRHADLENIMGMFVNTLAVRNSPSGEKTFADFLNEVKEKTLKALENQEYPYEELVEQLPLNRDVSRNPLFDTMFTYQNIGAQEIEIPGLKLAPYENENKTSKFDLTLIGEDREGELYFTIEYCVKLFKLETIERLIGYFKNVIKEVIENKDRRISEIEIITEEEKNRILTDFNDTEREYPKDKTIHRLFEEQVEKTPDHMALLGCPSCLTYNELNEESNFLANKLIEKGVEPDTIVAIKIERSIEMIIGVLGILKSGGAYLPIDPNYPQDRIDYMLKDSGAAILLTEQEIRLSSSSVFSMPSAAKNSQPATTLAYIIYTSGSTGRPKGVMVDHQGVVNYIKWAEVFYLKDEKCDFPLYSSLAFDLTVTSIYVPLISGNTIVLYNRDDNEFVISRIIREGWVKILKLTPTHLRMLKYGSGEYRGIRRLIVGGENLTTDLAGEMNRFFNEDVEIYNEYGPTEATVGCMIYKFDPVNDRRESVPIGIPISNLKIYIMDRNFFLQPTGVAGELCISGDGLARGYLNRPELTAERFISRNTNTIYKTGDLARWLPDGNIEFLGRLDYQVKIRGYRIELGEIEKRLSSHELIKEAVVIESDTRKGEKEICAYIVCKKAFEIIELREYLGKRLPDYMIPAYFVTLDKIPLTPSGKVDRRALPLPEAVAGRQHVAPRNEIEKKLAGIWSDVLNVENEKIGIEDNFFHLGGHSLKATVLISKIHKNLNVNFPLEEVFRASTIRGMSGYIKEAKEVKYLGIEAVEAKEYYMVSSAQKRLHFLIQMDKSGTSYNIPAAWILEGVLDRGKLENTFAKLIKRNESLRTSFEMIEEEPVQRIHKEVEFAIQYLATEDTEKKVCDFIRPFDLAKVPLMRVGLVKLEEEKHIMVIDMSHIISDGMSMGLLIRDFTSLYSGKELRELKVHYKDYAEWRNREKGGENHVKQSEYWKKEYEGDIPILELPLDYARPAIQSFEGNRIKFEIRDRIVGVLERLTMETGATLYMTLLAIYNIFLSKVSGQEDIVIGVPVAGRRHADLEGIVGMFVNTLVLRNNPAGEKKFAEFLEEVKEKTLKALENQEYPYEELVEQLPLNRDVSRNPLFDTMFTYQNIGAQEIEIPGLKLASYENENKTSKFDLTLVGEESGGELYFTIEYCEKLFKQETIERFIGYIKSIVKGIIESKDRKISEIEILTEEEKNQVLYDFNDTEKDYPKDKAIHSLIEEQVERTPDNIAVVNRTEQITYRELNKKSNRLAHMLKEKGAHPNTIIGIMIERSVEMMIGINGILKAGGAYLPIATDYPPERVQYMLEDSESPLVLTRAKIAGSFKFKREVIDIETGCRDGDDRNIEIKSSPQDMVYMIYTSGSTGKPKGVMVKIKGFENLLHWYVEEFGIEEKGNILLIAPISFDLAQKNLFSAHMVGGRLTLAPPGIPNYRELTEIIHNEQVTLINCAPSVFYPLVELNSDNHYINLNTLRKIILGGEPIQVEKLQGWVKSENYGSEIVNTYGPTECTDIASSYRIPAETFEQKGIIPIGKPISNVNVYILDKYQGLLPVKIAGELCIGGIGLGKGYYNNEQLTKEKFVETPHLPEKKVYRTGDLTRWLPDGNIEFLGRIDHQVKIRGFRVELGEIEAELSKHEEINDAVVVARESEKTENYLCAYIVGRRELGITELREYLGKSFPDYMIPAYFTNLDKIPLTPSGKVDRRALPLPEAVAGRQYVAPRNEIEKKLAGIWSDVLNVEKEKIGIEDNFFHLGGHSLKATVLISKIHKNLNVNFPLEEVFRASTIRGMSGYIKEAKEVKYLGIEAVEAKEYYMVSSAQKRLHFLIQMDKSGTSYNIPAAWILEGVLDRGKLESTFAKLIKRNESLRTSFEMIEEEPVQRIHKEVEFAIQYLATEDTEKKVCDFIRPFDLAKVPLMRVGLVKLEEEKHIMVIDMSHIISDGMSMELLIRDFTSLYSGKELRELKVHYKDYAEWRNREKGGENHVKQSEYWKKEYEGDIPILELPLDYARPAIQSFEGNRIKFEIRDRIVGVLERLTMETGATLYMTLLAIYNIFLSKVSGQEDIVIGVPVAGRRHADLEGIVGMFVNTLVLRNNPAGEKKFAEFLEEVKEKTLKALENQEYPYEELVEQLPLNRDVSRNPLFDTMFTYQNIGAQEIEIPGLKLASYENENKTSKFDLTLVGEESGGELYFTIEYCEKLFKQETIERFIGYIKSIVKGIIESKDRKISEIEILTEEEKNQVLYDFNDTEKDYPKDKAIHSLIEEQVERTPDNIAVVNRTEQITYRELNKKSNRLAHMLKEKGAHPNTIIGIMIERSVEMMIGINGILKAGGAYLPIATDYPPERVQYMLEDSESPLVLTRAKIAGSFKFKGEVIDIETGCRDGDDRNIEIKSSPQDMVYMIYTSGSTGKPKGVMVKIKGFENLLHWYVEEFGIEEKGNILLIAPISFDLAQKNLFSAHMVGGRLTLAPPGIPNYRELTEIIHNEQVTLINCAPSVFYPLVELNSDNHYINLNTLRKIILGGEPIQVEKLQGWVKSENYGSEIVNTYGPTECTDIASSYRIPVETFEQKGIIPIGKPISNVNVYILDKYHGLLPVKIAGELCIGGIGLGKGYYNNEQLTKEKFVETPHLPEKKVYRTGDLTRWLPDGNIEFLGRIDHQVKIRGFRVELGEIEAELSKHEEINDAVVVARESEKTENYLCAYIVGRRELGITELREYLGKSLPDYMIPAYFTNLDKIPLTPSGKVDRRALPLPEAVAGRQYVAPRNEIEKKLAGIWSDVLNVEKEKIGIEDNFFHLGGHSLKATVLISKIHKNLNVNFPLEEVFRASTIRGMSGYIKEAKEVKYLGIDAVEAKEYYLLSSVQKRLYVVQRMQEESKSYNIPTVVRIEGGIDQERLNSIFQMLIKRHESLRTSFIMIEGEVVQVIHQDFEFMIDYNETNEKNVENILEIFSKPFDLSKAPLLRVGLIKTGEYRSVLMVDMHHIISDGVSHEILVKEFSQLYKGENLSPLRIHYKDYSEWQNRLSESGEMKKQKEFWLNKFKKGEIPSLNMPLDYSRPLVRDIDEGGHVAFFIEDKLCKKIFKLMETFNVTLSMILIAAYNILLYRNTRQEDIIIGIVVTGRTHPDLERMIGMFVNTLPLRNHPHKDITVIEFLEEVKNNSLSAFENQDYPFEELVVDLGLQGEIDKNPLFDVAFNLNNIERIDVEDSNLNPTDWQIKSYNKEKEFAKFDLTLYAFESKEIINLVFRYSTQLFKPITIERLKQCYIEIIDQVVDNVDVKLKDITFSHDFLMSKIQIDEDNDFSF